MKSKIKKATKNLYQLVEIRFINVLLIAKIRTCSERIFLTK